MGQTLESQRVRDPQINLPASLDLKGVTDHLQGISATRNLFAHCGVEDSRFKSDPQKVYEDFKKCYETVGGELKTIRDCFATRYPSTFVSRC